MSDGLGKSFQSTGARRFSTPAKHLRELNEKEAAKQDSDEWGKQRKRQRQDAEEEECAAETICGQEIFASVASCQGGQLIPGNCLHNLPTKFSL